MRASGPRRMVAAAVAGALLAGALAGGASPPALAAEGEGEPFDPAICADYAANATEAEKDPRWAIKRMQVPKVHQLATGRGIRIAVLDTGVDTSRNPELTREGRPTVTRSYNFAGYDKGPRGNGEERRADCSHGTQVASLIVGTAEPGGFVGLAPDAEVISMRTLQKAAPARVNSGQESEPEPLEPTIRAIRKAIELRVDVINISQQGSDSFEYKRAISDAVAAGIVVVAAAGNMGGANRAPYPASYREVIAVGMSDINDQPHPQSQYHPQMTVSVGAPGVAVLAANPSGPQGQSWSTVDGTSFAAPLVSATVALMLERNRRLTPDQVRRRLETSADPPTAATPDKQLGHGVINPYRALTDIDFGTPGPTPPPVGGRAPDPTRPASTTRGGKLAVLLGICALGGVGLATALFAAHPSGRRRGWKVR